MLSLFRRSVLQSQRAVLCRTQQRVASVSPQISHRAQQLPLALLPVALQPVSRIAIAVISLPAFACMCFALQLSYTVVGEERRSTVATEATSAATGASEAPPQPESTEFDSDAEDFVTKEVQTHNTPHACLEPTARK
jgi:hypothetical protein